MEDVYTCSCGNQTWLILENVVRCAACNLEYPAQHTPVNEFNHMVNDKVQEDLEDAGT
jgi:hypothetical protein